MPNAEQIKRPLTLVLGFAACAVLLIALCASARAQAQKPGELLFTANTSTEKDAGVWIDGKYAGYLKELKGDGKVTLPPGEHEVSVRMAGYKDFTQRVTVASGQSQTIAVSLTPDSTMTYPGSDAATLRLDVKPKRAAVYVDGNYMGHGSDFGGRFHALLLIPGTHRIRVEMENYQTTEKDVTVYPSGKSQLTMELACNPGATCK